MEMCPGYNAQIDQNDEVSNMKKLSSPWFSFYRFILGALGVYFLLMGSFLILFPNLLLDRLSQQVTPAIVGIIRGAGGATVPYALLYILLAAKPAERQWASYVILFANGLAVILDLVSLFIVEYTLMQSIIDLPVEILSFVVIITFHNKFDS